MADVIADVADHVAELIFVCDDLGHIHWANDAVARVLGHRPDEWIGRHGSALAHPDDVALGMELMVSAKATGPGVKEPVTYRLSCADGGWIELECVATTVEVEDGRLAFVLSFRPSGMARPVDAIFDEASRRVSLMFEEAAIGMAQIDLDQRILRANATLAQILRTSTTVLTGRRFTDYVHPEDELTIFDRSDGQAADGSTADGSTADGSTDDGASSTQVRLVAHGADPLEASIHARVTASLVLDHRDSPLYFAVQVSDVTDLVEAQRSQAESEQRFRSILELGQEGVLAVDGDYVVRFANQRLADMLDCTTDDLMGRSSRFLMERFAVDLEMDFDDWAPGEALRFETRMQTTTGEIRWVQVAANPGSWPIDGALGTVVMITDIDALKAAEVDLRHRSTHDPLTGLANRTLLEAAWEASAGETTVDAVIVLDLDGFKAVNDTYGHAEGDTVLVEVARRLTDGVRRGDLVARFGGDEFVVVCRGADRTTAEQLAQRLVTDLNESFAVGDHVFDLGASAGLAMGRPGATHVQLLREADLALYEAKRRGGRQVGPLAPSRDTSP